MSTRRLFHPLLFKLMERDEKIVLCTADLGYKMFDRIRDAFPDRFYNVGASEQLLVGAGVGLALSGKIPVCYSITPFLLYRPAEWLRNYLDHEKIGVKLLGGGRDGDYAHDGYTHYCDHNILSAFPNIKSYLPTNEAELADMTHLWLYGPGPAYLNLQR